MTDSNGLIEKAIQDALNHVSPNEMESGIPGVELTPDGRLKLTMPQKGDPPTPEVIYPLVVWAWAGVGNNLAQGVELDDELTNSIVEGVATEALAVLLAEYDELETDEITISREQAGEMISRLVRCAILTFLGAYAIWDDIQKGNDGRPGTEPQYS